MGSLKKGSMLTFFVRNQKKHVPQIFPLKKVAICFHEDFYFPKKIYIIHPIQTPNRSSQLRKAKVSNPIKSHQKSLRHKALLGESVWKPTAFPPPRRCVLWLKKLGNTSHSSFDEMMIGGSSQMFNVWPSYLHFHKCRPNVGKYTIHWAYRYL